MRGVMLGERLALRKMRVKSLQVIGDLQRLVLGHTPEDATRVRGDVEGPPCGPSGTVKGTDPGRSTTMSTARQEVRGVPEAGGTPLAGRRDYGGVVGHRTGHRPDARWGRRSSRTRRPQGRADRGLKEKIGQSGGEALALPTEVTAYTQAEAMVSRAEEAFGGVDVLVNVADVMLPAPVAEADPADWRRMVEVNLMGVLHATRAALPGMLERGNGHIVNVSSTSGRVASPLFSVYAATKYILGAFTEVLRKEVRPNRVRVTLFEPGPTQSELGSHVDLRSCDPSWKTLLATWSFSGPRT